MEVIGKNDGVHVCCSRMYVCGVQQLPADVWARQSPSFRNEITRVALQVKTAAAVLCLFRCVALSHGEMVPAVSLFSELQEQLTTHSRKIESGRPGWTSDKHDRHTFKGQSLLTPQQLRDQLKVRFYVSAASA
jgi:hypothetical protein